MWPAPTGWRRRAHRRLACRCASRRAAAARAPRRALRVRRWPRRPTRRQHCHRCARPSARTGASRPRPGAHTSVRPARSRSHHAARHPVRRRDSDRPTPASRPVRRRSVPPPAAAAPRGSAWEQRAPALLLHHVVGPKTQPAHVPAAPSNVSFSPRSSCQGPRSLAACSSLMREALSVGPPCGRSAANSTSAASDESQGRVLAGCHAPRSCASRRKPEPAIGTMPGTSALAAASGPASLTLVTSPCRRTSPLPSTSAAPAGLTNSARHSAAAPT